MGLDMYLEKHPRMGLTPRTINAVNGFASWVKEGMEYGFTDWCGYKESDLPSTTNLMKLLEMRHVAYYVWDDRKEFPYETISDQVGYWRKANAIHNWFVKYVQDGVDDCEYHRAVTKQDLEKLADLCKTVLDNPSKAHELLPVADGFFFGSLEYDEWYFKDIEKTAELCEHLINGFDFENYDLYYVSSW